MKTIELTEMCEGDIQQLRELFFECNDYFYLIDGVSVCGCRAEKEFHLKPFNKCKRCYSIYSVDKMIGTVFLIENYPLDNEWTISLLLISPEYRNQGIGKYIVDLIEGMVELQGGAKLIVGVDEINRKALSFWKGSGFVETGQRLTLHHETRDGEILYLEKVLK